MASEQTEIAEHILNETGEALRVGDFARFFRHFWVPTKIWTEIGEVDLASEKAIRDCFERVRWHHRSLRVTKVCRKCDFAVRTGNNTIMSLHSVKLLRGAFQVQAPHKVLSKIEYDGTDWKVSSSDYGIKDSLKHNRALLGAIEVRSSIFA